MPSSARITEFVNLSNDELLRLAFYKLDVSALELELALRLEQQMDMNNSWDNHADLIRDTGS